MQIIVPSFPPQLASMPGQNVTFRMNKYYIFHDTNKGFTYKHLTWTHLLSSCCLCSSLVIGLALITELEEGRCHVVVLFTWSM